MRLDSFTTGRNINSYLTLDNTNGGGAQDLKFSMTRLTTNTDIRTSGTALVVGEWTFICAVSLSDNTNMAARIWVGKLDTPPVLQTFTTTAAGSGNPLLNQISVLNNGASGTNAIAGTTDGWGGVGSQDSTSTTSWLGLSSFASPTADDETLMLNRVVIPAWEGKPAPVIPSVAVTSPVFINLQTYQNGNGDYTPGMQARRLTGNFTNTVITPLGTILSAERCPRTCGNIDFPYLRR